MSNLNSNQIERSFLGGLIQNQGVFAEIEGFLTDKDFCAKTHDVIFSCIKSSLLNNEKVDKILLSQKIKNLGISFKDDINIFDYVEAITFSPITYQATIGYAKELVKLRVLRDIDTTCDKIKSHILKSINEPLDKVITEVDAIYGEKINAYSVESGDTPLYNGLLELAEFRGNNPREEVGLATPFSEFNRLYGGLRNKNLYFIIARAKAGKSTWLNELASEMSRIHDMPVLYLDTEMSLEENQFRAIASKTGVPLWYIETGNWRKNPEFVKKIRETLKDSHNKYKVNHLHVGNKNIEQIGSIARRWHLKKVGRGNKCMVVFDYVKIPEGEGHQQEYQLMGYQVDFLKQLSDELDCPIVTAGQSNRSGITTNKKVSDLVEDESVVGISDRINWYATYVGYLRRKVIEEIALDTPESGTHLLMELVARFQGKDAAGHQDLIKRTFPDGKTRYIKNYINFSVDNFRVEEKGSLIHSIKRQNAQFLLTDDHTKNGPNNNQTL